MFGEGERLEKKHKTKRKRRSRRKLHLGLDLVSGQIVCSDLALMTLVIRPSCRACWIRSTVPLTYFWRTVLTMASKRLAP
ncbi:hypothetical protein P775_24670 [Puniceibacterium antarcticum]|uniref:Transposase IS4-like domain-containing protein n=1 Tax=Puniceibacterium antarcticum TaxID=1206336 RepID=A0A2G8R6R0_9RHOB|nr:hypothetical protein [Puniceibacterium antarcticum]PIL17240.1 hypothetical protein P775_24670 [Puniceibacterium antarcticum]